MLFLLLLFITVECKNITINVDSIEESDVYLKCKNTKCSNHIWLYNNKIIESALTCHLKKFQGNKNKNT